MPSLLNEDFVFHRDKWEEPSGLNYYLANNLEECIDNVIAATKGRPVRVAKVFDRLIEEFGAEFIETNKVIN